VVVLGLAEVVVAVIGVVEEEDFVVAEAVQVL
jgi:hypothetical protein